MVIGKITSFDAFVALPCVDAVLAGISGRVQQHRKEALEKMGISVQSVGISVQKNKFYRVNLNADPSLYEMLVYYLKVSRFLPYL